MPRWSWLAGAVAGPLFVLSFLLQAPSRPGYDALRHPVSSLAFGDRGWVQVVTFVVTGGLLAVFSVGLWRERRQPGHSRWGALLIGAMGVGMIGAGIFLADPLSGYPPGTPGQPITPSLHRVLHDLFSTPVFLGLPLACVLFGRQFARIGERGWASFSVASGVGMLAAFVVSSIGFGQNPNLVAFGGLFQRIAVVIGFAWLSLLALRERSV